MKFIIEQVAIAPEHSGVAKTLLRELGAEDWSEDHVCADGKVFGNNAGNEANLSFNYDLLKGGGEFEILDYTGGPNWIKWCRPTVSHFGMHCTAEELVQWRAFFAERDICVAQEVKTLSHTNAMIAGKRSYNYVIFNTRPILGVDLKFIVRIDK